MLARAILSPAPRRRSATWRRSAATSCSARAATTSTTTPRAATSARPARAATRSTASTASTRSSARRPPASRPIRRTCASRSPRSTRSCISRARTARARCRSPICTACPATRPTSRPMLEPGELITAVELPPLPFAARSTYRKVRDRASYAFALVSVAAALELDGRHASATCGSRSAASRTSPWRALQGRGGAARRRRRREAAFRAAAEAELADAPAARDNAFKIELAKRTIVGRARRAAAGVSASERDAVVQKPPIRQLAPTGCCPAAPDPLIGAARAHRPAGLARRRPAQGDAARRASPPRSPLDGHGLRGARSTARSRAAASPRSIPRAAEAAPGVVLVMTHENAPRMKPPPRVHGDRRRRRRPAICRSCRTTGSTGTASRSRWCSPRRRSRRTTPRRWSASTYAAEPAVTSFDEAQGAGAAARARARRAAARSRSATPRRRSPRRRTSVDATYRTPRHNHNAIELHAVTVAWEGDDACTVHDAHARLVHRPRWTLADVFGIDGRARCTCSRPSSAAGSAASACGATRSCGRGRAQARAAAGAARRCRAKACSGSSAAAR